MVCEVSMLIIAQLQVLYGLFRDCLLSLKLLKTSETKTTKWASRLAQGHKYAILYEDWYYYYIVTDLPNNHAHLYTKIRTLVIY